VLGAVAATWRARLGGHAEPFAAAFLQRAAKPAGAVPCPRHCGCAHEVVQVRPGELVGVCRCDSWACEDVVLGPEDIAVWELSWSRLGRALCRALGLQVKAADLNLRHTRQIGSWSAEAVPVVLTVQMTRRDLGVVIGTLAARLRQPFILLSPTAGNLDALGKELLANVGAGFFDLDSIVALTPEGTLRCLRPPGELFVRFNPQATEPLAEEAARQAFALVRALDAATPARKAPLYTVFRLYCVEGLTIAQVARNCRCARSLIFLRLTALARKLGAHPRTLRQYSSHFERIEETLSDSRARRISRAHAGSITDK
jgi:hypothetical protein